MATQFRSGCPIASSLDLVGDKWSLVLIRTLAFGPKRFGELARIPERIASNILAERLRRLEAAGLVRREEEGDAPARYALTRRGAGLLPAVQALARWGEAELPDRWASPSRFFALRPEDFG